jgi:hypothetical protein
MAMLGILVILGLALILMWQVYLHHRHLPLSDDESALVRSSRPQAVAFSRVTA